MTVAYKRSGIDLLALAIIQGGNALFPIVVFPYLFATIGAEVFSRIVTAESVALLLLALCLYSFDVTGVKKVLDSLGRGGEASVYKVFFGILYSRFFVFLVGAGGGVVFLGLFLEEYIEFFLIWLLLPLGVVLQSAFYYQAVGKNIVLAFFVLSSRVSACVLVFLMVKGEGDAVLGLALLASSFFLSGLASLFYVISRNKFDLMLGEIKNVPILLKDGWLIFLGNVSVVLYRGSNVIILSLLSGTPLAISLYAVAEKYVKMLQALVLPLSQLFFARTVKELSAGGGRAISILWRNSRVQVYISCAAVFLFVLAGWVDFFAFHKVFSLELLTLVAVMSLAVPCGVANFMFGVVGLSSLGLDGVFARVTFFVGLISIAVSSVMALYASSIGVAVNYFLSELLMFMLVFSALKKGCKRA